MANDSLERYGALKESTHTAGYTFERACAHLEWLLEKDRWKLGDRFDDVNKFLDSVRLDEFRTTVEARKRIAAKIKKLQPKASMRQIGRTLGVKKDTVRRDLAGANAPVESESANENNGANGDGGANAPLSGAEAARLVGRRDRGMQSLFDDKQRESYRAEQDVGCTVSDLSLLIEAGKKFSVIYADPPWEFKVYSGKGKQRSAERRYDTKPLDLIKALPISQLAADDCALFLWSVWPELPGAIEVIRSWGFEYKTAGFVWVKQNPSGDGLKWGMGYWTRANSEPCLFATRGSPKRLAKDVHQIVTSPVGEHSRKPDEVAARIERLIGGPYLELYGRRPTPNWTVWGDQIIRGLFHDSIPHIGGGEHASV